MNSYQKCPVCRGRGIVPEGFYERLGKLDREKTEACRPCQGQGVIYLLELTLAPNTQPYTPYEPYVHPWPFTTWVGDPPGSIHEPFSINIQPTDTVQFKIDNGLF